jgi:hypothetical protein
MAATNAGDLEPKRNDSHSDDSRSLYYGKFALLNFFVTPASSEAPASLVWRGCHFQIYFGTHRAFFQPYSSNY